MAALNNSERLRSCSATVSKELEKLSEQGVAYYDDASHFAAVKAINDHIPDLSNFVNQLVEVDASQAMAIEADKKMRGYSEGIHVAGVLRSVSIQQIIDQMGSDEGSIEYKTHDLCAIIVPRYYDPDPQDIVFGKELYVPFSGILGFEKYAA